MPLSIAGPWISTHTQLDLWVNEILGSDGRFYGYLYYSQGPVALEQIGRRKICVQPGGTFESWRHPIKSDHRLLTHQAPRDRRDV